jgi:DNA-binding NarL/FixJ family response regulator
MLKVLLIESDPTLRDIIEVGLETFQGFDVDHARDAGAVDMAQEKNYDLIIVNVELGDSARGIEVIRAIRKFDESAEILALARGRSSRLLTKEKASSNLFAILSVPIDEQNFFKTISRVKDRLEAKSGEAAADEE